MYVDTTHIDCLPGDVLRLVLDQVPDSPVSVVCRWWKRHSTIRKYLVSEISTLELMKWLIKKKMYKLGYETCAQVAAGGNVEILAWLRNLNHHESQKLVWAEVSSYAASKGRIHVLEWVVANQCPLSTFACIAASTHGHLDTLKWLIARKFPSNLEVSIKAARHGHLHILKWIRESESLNWGSAQAAVAAAAGGHIHVLEWIFENRLPRSTQLPAHAARSGHIHVLKWLRQKGCPWNSHVCKCAAKAGQLNTLQWLRADGDPERKSSNDVCPWDVDVLKAAYEYGYPVIANWIKENSDFTYSPRFDA